MRAAHKTAAVIALALTVAACSQGSTNTAPTTVAAKTVASPSATEIYDLRERCAKDAREALRAMHEKKNSPNHISMYSNHYDLATNDCYLLIYTIDGDGKHPGSTSYLISSVSDGRVVGVFMGGKSGGIRGCQVHGRECGSEEQFKSMAQPYTGEGG